MSIKIFMGGKAALTCLPRELAEECKARRVALLPIPVAWLHGLNVGYRMAGRSLFRRFIAQIIVTVLLIGGSLGCLWAAADVFSRLATGEEITKRVVGKWQAYFRVYPARQKGNR
jgi:hypothetical protein